MIVAGMEEWIVLLGRTHPLIVHLPIGILFLGVLVECVAYFPRYAGMRVALPFIWGCCSAFAVLACLAGFALADEGGFEENILLIHQWLGIGVAVFCLILFFVYRFQQKRSKLLTPVVSLMSLIVVSAAGHFGGTLTHGEDYLNEALRSAFNIVSNDTTSVASRERKPIEDINEAVLYSDLVEPVLESKCYRCHDQKKQKGKLRLDEYHFVLAGGKSGSSVIAGKPMESELYKRLLLPEDDKKRMPPKGKPQLTKDEITLIHWWIQEGKAAADRKVSEVRKPTDIDVALASFASHKEFVSEMETEIPDKMVSEASEELIKPLRDAGLVVNRFSPELPFLTVNCVNAGDFNDEQTRLLLPLKDQIIWLKAGSTKITDKGLETIAKLSHLTRLSLEHTDISDKGIAMLTQLPELRYLNVVNTKVSGSSAEALSQCRKLRVVYLWQTSFTAADQSKLRERMPGLEINVGEQ